MTTAQITQLLAEFFVLHDERVAIQADFGKGKDAYLLNEVNKIDKQRVKLYSILKPNLHKVLQIKGDL